MVLEIKGMFRNRDLVKNSKDGCQDSPINFDTSDQWHAVNRIRVCLTNTPHNISQIDVKRETLWRISFYTHCMCFCNVTCTRAHVLLQLIEAAASKYTYVTVHDNESFTRCAGVYHVRCVISSWRDSETAANAKNGLYASYVGFMRRKPFRRKRWNGVLSRRLTYLCIFIGRHIVPFLWHNAPACA